MKAEVFADVLQAHAQSISLAGDRDAARAVRTISTTLLGCAGSGAVAALLKKLDKRRTSSRSPGQTIEQQSELTMSAVEPHLSAFEKTLRATGAKAAATDVSALIEFLQPYHDRKIGFAVSEIARLAMDPPKSVAKKSAVAQIDPVRVRELADKLTRANEVPSDFNALAAELKADKSVSKPLMEQVANQFLGIQLKYKSRADIFKKIEDRHYIDTLNESRGRIIDRISI